MRTHGIAVFHDSVLYCSPPCSAFSSAEIKGGRSFRTVAHTTSRRRRSRRESSGFSSLRSLATEHRGPRLGLRMKPSLPLRLHNLDGLYESQREHPIRVQVTALSVGDEAQSLTRRVDHVANSYRSSSRILNRGRTHDLVPEVPAEVLGRPQVHFSPEQRREFRLHSGEADHAGSMPFFELDQHVYVTVRTEVLAQYGAEKRVPGNVVPPTETGELRLGR